MIERLHSASFLLATVRFLFLFSFASFAFLCVLCVNALIAGHQPAVVVES